MSDSDEEHNVKPQFGYCADDANWPCFGWVGPAFPVMVHPLNLTQDPLPIPSDAVDAIQFFISEGWALRLRATEQKYIDRFCDALGLIVTPHGAGVAGHA